METALLSFFSITTIVYCVVIYFVVQILRSLIEAFAVKLAIVWPDRYEQWFTDLWREWILPALPILAGGLIAYFVPMYPFPEAFAVSVSGRVFFGIVAGGASGMVYRFFKFYLKKYLPQELKDKLNSINPGFLSSNPPALPEPPKVPDVAVPDQTGDVVDPEQVDISETEPK